MKLLFCELCGDIVAPHPDPAATRRCRCGFAAVWWDDPAAGRLAVYAAAGARAVSVLGIMNDLLRAEFTLVPGGPEVLPGGGPTLREFGIIQGDRVRKMVEDCPGSYAFKHVGSVIIRCRPGYTNDTRLAPMAEAAARKGA